MRNRLLIGIAVVAALVTGACGDDDDTADTTTTTVPTITSTTIDYSRFKSTDTVAVNLDQSLMSAAEVKAGVSLGADLVAYPGRGNAPPPPQGPLNLDGIVAVFPSEAYKGALETGKASVGANRTFLEPQKAFVLNTLAVKFESATTGAEFVKFATNVATTVGGGKITQHPELKVGVLPGQVIRVPPSAGATPPTETVVAAVLYPNGVYYQTSIVGAVGAVTDEMVIAYVKAQSAKYAQVKAELGLS